MPSFTEKLTLLKAELVSQSERVVDHTLRGVESFFDNDREKARDVIAGDGPIDRVDVEIEHESIGLLMMGSTEEYAIRSVLTIVKVNNELERIADCAVNVAEQVTCDEDSLEGVPPTFRVMANSVIGMLREASTALRNEDVALAERVLSYDDAVDQFKSELSLDAQEKVAAGVFTARFAFRILRVSKALERIADHCTNICEQVIYLQTGNIVRHLPGGWTKPAPPET